MVPFFRNMSKHKPHTKHIGRSATGEFRGWEDLYGNQYGKHIGLLKDLRPCETCGEEFDAKKEGQTRETRTDRKFKISFCSGECADVHDKGLV